MRTMAHKSGKGLLFGNRVVTAPAPSAPVTHHAPAAAHSAPTVAAPVHQTSAAHDCVHKSCGHGKSAEEKQRGHAGALSEAVRFGAQDGNALPPVENRSENARAFPPGDDEREQ